MTDIFHSWKQNRFIVAPDVLTDHEKLIILTDIQFWADNVDTLALWCEENGCTTEGMTVVLTDDRALTAFCLRWA